MVIHVGFDEPRDSLVHCGIQLDTDRARRELGAAVQLPQRRPDRVHSQGPVYRRPSALPGRIQFVTAWVRRRRSRTASRALGRLLGQRRRRRRYPCAWRKTSGEELVGRFQTRHVRWALAEIVTQLRAYDRSRILLCLEPGVSSTTFQHGQIARVCPIDGHRDGRRAARSRFQARWDISETKINFSLFCRRDIANASRAYAVFRHRSGEAFAR